MIHLLLLLLLGAAAPLKVVTATASSALPKWKEYTFGAHNVIDGRNDTSWQPGKKNTLGVGQWLELDLGAPHEISRIQIVQGLQKVDPTLGDLFCRNNRFAAATIFFDDGSYAPVWNEPQLTELDVTLFYRGEDLPGKEVKVVTRYLRLVITSVHTPVDWKDIAIAELKVFGRPAPAATGSVKCGEAGFSPLRNAIIESCAVDVAGRKANDCAGLMRALTSCEAVEVTADNTKGNAEVAVSVRNVRHTVTLVREAAWKVKRHTRLEAGKPAPPGYEVLVEDDPNEQNPCWDKLGKERPAPE